MGLRRGRSGIALPHHHPTDIFDHRLAALVVPFRAHVDDAALPVRVFLEPDDLRGRRQRIACKHRLREPAIGVAEIGDRVERDVGHRLAEHDMEGEQIVDRACRIADGARESLGALGRKAHAVKRGIERGVATGQRMGRRVVDRLAEAKVLEEPPRGGLAGGRNHSASEHEGIDVIDDDPLDQHHRQQEDDRRNVDAAGIGQEIADRA